MALALRQEQSLELWRRTLAASVRREAPDLTSRQMAMLLTVYMGTPPHTVRGLAADLNVPKPAITRALDRLAELGFIRRAVDDSDRRSIFVQRTVKGAVFLSEFADLIAEAGRDIT
jgi:DNA-binding MarR family transcriptional regulator